MMNDAPPAESPSDKPDAVKNQWEKPSTERLLAGGFFKSLEGIITGTISGIWMLIILPRLVPQAEVYGILAVAGTFLGFLGSFLDWGVWTGFQMVVARSLQSKDNQTTLKYTQTIMSFKIINGIAYNLLVLAFLVWLFPLIHFDYPTAYYFVFIFVSTRWFGGFLAMFDHIISGANRFDYEFYISLIKMGSTIGFKLLWLWITNTFLFPGNIIIANAVGIAISEMFETLTSWFLQGLVIYKLKILPLKQALRPGFDREAFKFILRYGTFVVARQYLIYFSEVNAFLWVFILRSIVINAEAMVGLWVIAINSIGLFYTATNLTRPMFPAIADAYNRKDQGLIRKYWMTMMKWYLLWCWISLGFYVGWGEVAVVVLSGEIWRPAGFIMALISPTFFLRLGNEYFTNILNAIGKPHTVLAGTALRIPILLFGGFFLFGNVVGMAIIFFGIELVYFVFSYRKIKKYLQIETPSWIVIIPGIACGCTFLLVKVIFMFWVLPDEFAKFVLLYLFYFLIFFAIFLSLGGWEPKDFQDIEKALKMVFTKGNFAHACVNGIEKLAKISPLYGKNHT